ncbi:MAG: trypsin-like serine protease [Phycisphaeraceae bacterium]
MPAAQVTKSNRQLKMQPISRIGFLRSIALILWLTSPLAHSAQALVTSNGEDNIAHPGQPAIDGLDHHGVARIRASYVIAEAGWGTGALLSDGQHVLTAAHVVDDLVRDHGVVDEFQGVRIAWVLADGEFVPVDVGLNAITRHPDYQEIQSNHDIRGPLGGFDVAIIKLPEPARPEITRYDLIDPGTELLNEKIWMAGYGQTGDGINGLNVLSPVGVTKRVGTNRFEIMPDPNDPNLANHHTMIGWIFQDNGEEHEVTNVRGDSGGPIFLNIEDEYRIGSVISWSRPEPNAHNFGLYGEEGYGVKLTANNVFDPNTTILEWIGDVTGLSASLNGPSGSSFDDANAWAFGTPAGPSAAAYITGDKAGTTIYHGPAASGEIGSLLVGRGLDVKAFDLNHTGSFVVNGDVTVDTNGQLGLRRGGFVADRLIVQGTTPAPGPPQPEAGLFVWTDLDELGSSSITVTHIDVRAGGDFVHDWLNPNTGTLQADEMHIDDGGRAFFEWHASGIGHLENDGVLSLTTAVVGNQLTVDSFTQSVTGLTHFAVASPSGTGLAADQIVVTDNVSLDGGIDLELGLGATDTLIHGQTFDIITASSITGVFRPSESFLPVVDDLRLYVFYDATSAWIEVVEDHLLGDMNLDGVVDSVDVAPFTAALTDPGAYTTQYGIDPVLVGDINQDGIHDAVDVAPFVALLTGGGSSVPEPGSAALLAATAGLLLRRRR